MNVLTKGKMLVVVLLHKYILDREASDTIIRCSNIH